MSTAAMAHSEQNPSLMLLLYNLPCLREMIVEAFSKPEVEIFFNRENTCGHGGKDGYWMI